MSSERDLRQRIEELSQTITEHEQKLAQTIAQHKQIVRDLQEQIRATNSDLNDLCDPMARMPLEICSEIFTRCLPPTPDMRAALRPSHVCRRWNDIALATPSLWTAITDRSAPFSAYPALLEMWLNRGKNSPLTMSLYRQLDTYLVEALEKHAHRVQNWHMLGGSVPLDHIPYLFAGLTFVTIQIGYSCSVAEIFGVLRGALNLVELNLVGIEYFSDDFLRETGPLIHRSLQRLYMGRLGESPYCARILRHLTLPALQCLSMVDLEMILPGAELLEFFNRSSPPLQSLEIIACGRDVRDTIACLKLLAPLTRLIIVFNPICREPDAFLEELAAVPDALPAIQDFQIHADMARTTGYQHLLTILKDRRASLASFWLQQKEDNAPLEGEMVVAFRELADDGMKILIKKQDIIIWDGSS